MIAASAPVWKTLRVCPADPLALAHPQANLNQSQGCRGEVSEESQHLIGELLEVCFFIFPISGGHGTAAHSSPRPVSSKLAMWDLWQCRNFTTTNYFHHFLRSL